jgi:hypothetical protein
MAVNPLTVESQFQGGLGCGLTQLVGLGAITLKDGRVEQRNFDGYAPPYIMEVPAKIDVHIVPSAEAPTGCGEPPVPVISPAVVNALARLTGTRYRTLPFTEIVGGAHGGAGVSTIRVSGWDQELPPALASNHPRWMAGTIAPFLSLDKNSALTIRVRSIYVERYGRPARIFNHPALLWHLAAWRRARLNRSQSQRIQVSVSSHQSQAANRN